MNMLDLIAYKLLSRHREVTPKLYYDTQEKARLAGMLGVMRHRYWVVIVHARIEQFYWSFRG